MYLKRVAGHRRAGRKYTFFRPNTPARGLDPSSKWIETFVSRHETTSSLEHRLSIDQNSPHSVRRHWDFSFKSHRAQRSFPFRPNRVYESAKIHPCESAKRVAQGSKDRTCPDETDRPLSD